jgi:hypothetical protein
MKTKAALALLTLAILVTPAALRAQDAEDSHFGSLSEGDPKARKVIRGLVEDTKEMLADLIKAAAHRGTDESKSTDLWDSALRKHKRTWETKVAEAREASRAPREAALGNPRSDMAKGAISSWPSDWMEWSKAQVGFLNKLRNLDFAEWRLGVNEKIAAFEKGLEQDPQRFEKLQGEIRWASDEIADSREKLDAAASLADVQKEVRRFTRIWKLVSNVQRTVKARKKYIEDFLKEDEQKPETVKKGIQNAVDWANQFNESKLLDPMCKRAATAFAVQATWVHEAYEKAFDKVVEMNEPVVKEELFDDIPGFEGAGFALVKRIEEFEMELHRIEDSFK